MASKFSIWRPQVVLVMFTLFWSIFLQDSMCVVMLFHWIIEFILQIFVYPVFTCINVFVPWPSYRYLFSGCRIGSVPSGHPCSVVFIVIVLWLSHCYYIVNLCIYLQIIDLIFCCWKFVLHFNVVYVYWM